MNDTIIASKRSTRIQSDSCRTKLISKVLKRRRTKQKLTHPTNHFEEIEPISAVEMQQFRQSVNRRERQRMQDLNEAMEGLRLVVSCVNFVA